MRERERQRQRECLCVVIVPRLPGNKGNTNTTRITGPLAEGKCEVRLTRWLTFIAFKSYIGLHQDCQRLQAAGVQSSITYSFTNIPKAKG